MFPLLGVRTRETMKQQIMPVSLTLPCLREVDQISAFIAIRTAKVGGWYEKPGTPGVYKHAKCYVAGERQKGHNI
jgi:hypothetical protein